MQPADLVSHLTSEDTAAYLDRAVSESERARIEAHLGDCDACRSEIVDALRLLRGRSSGRRWVGGLGIAAAAAAVLVFVIRPGGLDSLPGSAYREAPITRAAAPTPITPRGAVLAVHSLAWTSVPLADRYRVRLFDVSGAVLWEAEVRDTTAAAPRAVGLTPGVAYYWKVEARTGFDRWAASDLTPFTITRSVSK